MAQFYYTAGDSNLTNISNDLIGIEKGLYKLSSKTNYVLNFVNLNINSFPCIKESNARIKITLLVGNDSDIIYNDLVKNLLAEDGYHCFCFSSDICNETKGSNISVEFLYKEGNNDVSIIYTTLEENSPLEIEITQIKNLLTEKYSHIEILSNINFTFVLNEDIIRRVPNTEFELKLKEKGIYFFGLYSKISNGNVDGQDKYVLINFDNDNIERI